jgi:hypothetical protein
MGAGEITVAVLFTLVPDRTDGQAPAPTLRMLSSFRANKPVKCSLKSRAFLQIRPGGLPSLSPGVRWSWFMRKCTGSTVRRGSSEPAARATDPRIGGHTIASVSGDHRLPLRTVMWSTGAVAIEAGTFAADPGASVLSQARSLTLLLRTHNARHLRVPV